MRTTSVLCTLLLLLSMSALLNLFIIFYVHNSIHFALYRDIENRIDFQHPVLPKHVILVSGLQSSGTKYITSALATATSAIKIKNDRPLEMKYIYDRLSGLKIPNQVEILHHSLPHGLWCTSFGKELENMTSSNLTKIFKSWTVPFIPPTQCSCVVNNIDGEDETTLRKDMSVSNSKVKIKHDFHEQQEVLPAKFQPSNKICDTWDANNARFGKNSHDFCIGLGIDKPIESPMRHFTNLTTHVKWYEDQGVRATVVIVVREQTIESLNKFKDHCHNKEIGMAENEYGKRFILEALDNLSQDGPTPNLVIISYETLMAFGNSYLKSLIYPKLGIEIDDNMFIPPILDANAPYINKTYVKGKKKLDRGHHICEDKLKDGYAVVKMRYYKGECITAMEFIKKTKIELEEKTNKEK